MDVFCNTAGSEDEGGSDHSGKPLSIPAQITMTAQAVPKNSKPTRSV